MRRLRKQLPPHHHAVLRPPPVRFRQPLRKGRACPGGGGPGARRQRQRGGGSCGGAPSQPLCLEARTRVPLHALAPREAPRGVVGIPRVLNIYEDYPFWFTVFTRLGFSVRLSPRSSRAVYEAGIETIPSESVCYPGKLVHGHVVRLMKEGFPSSSIPASRTPRRRIRRRRNHFNCPIVTSYPEVVLNNIDGMRGTGAVPLRQPLPPPARPAPPEGAPPGGARLGGGDTARRSAAAVDAAVRGAGAVQGRGARAGRGGAARDRAARAARDSSLPGGPTTSTPRSTTGSRSSPSPWTWPS